MGFGITPVCVKFSYFPNVLLHLSGETYYIEVYLSIYLFILHNILKSVVGTDQQLKNKGEERKEGTERISSSLYRIQCRIKIFYEGTLVIL